MPKYWEDSADLSRDSIAESDQGSEENVQAHSTQQDASIPGAFEDAVRTKLPRQPMSTSQTESIEEVNRGNTTQGTVSRVLATGSAQPTLESKQHTRLFYMSLIEGRCRSQAVNMINSKRSSGTRVTEDDPEVATLVEQLFPEMVRDLAMMGMIPDEFLNQPLPQLRSYLTSFDSRLQSVATQLPNVPYTTNSRALGSIQEHLSGLNAHPSHLLEGTSGRSVSLEDRWGFHSAEQPNATAGQRSLVSRRPAAMDFSASSDIFDRSTSIRAPIGDLSYNADTIPDASSQQSFTSENNSSIFGTFEHSQAVLPRNQSILVPQSFYTYGSSIPVMDAQTTNIPIPKSVFATDYNTIAMLGKGGFGAVVKVRSKLDMAEYAVKRIKYTAAKMRQLAERGNMNEIVNEIQALARYHHPHVVRYFHAWVETEPSQTTATNVWKEEERAVASGMSASLTSTRKSSLVGAVATEIANIALEDQQAINDVLHEQHKNNAAYDLSDSRIVFERETSLVGNHSRSFFRSALEPESPTESDEEQHAGQGTLSNDGTSSTISLSRHRTNEESLVLKGNPSMIPVFTDCTIYIKMTAYPLTLAEFIYPATDTPRSHEVGLSRPRHCFHSLPTIRLLLRILLGLSYLHRKQQIHRDLKPGNIFLSILEPGEPADKAWLDLNDCRECATQRRQHSPCHVSPCIGDFGLVVDLKTLEDELPLSPPTNSHNPEEGGSAPYQTNVQPKTPGTKLYIPPNQSTHNIICPKLDTYALGIITLELIYKFDTKSERMIVLDKARHGEWPKDFSNHELAAGIKGMMELEREKRWSCEGVRMWAEKMENTILNRVHTS